MKKNYLTIIILLITSLTFSQNIPDYVSKNGLVGWWPFNGNANDESGKGNNGNVVGAKLTSDRKGNQNSAYDFDGSSYIDCGSDNSLNFYNSLTINIWAKTSNFYSNCGLIGRWGNLKNSNLNNQYLLYFGEQSTETIKTIVYGNASNENIKQISYTDNKWHCYTMTYDGSYNSLYVDGVLISQTSCNFSIQNVTEKLVIGGYGLASLNGAGLKWNGQIDDIAIYNRALTINEIKDLYIGCKKQTATTSNFSNIILSNSAPINLTANPTGGTFSGKGITNNVFTPSKSNIGKQTIKYNFINSSSCNDSTFFNPIVYDTIGNNCKITTYDTVKVNKTVYDTLKIKVNFTAGTNINKENIIRIFPNPTSSDLIIDNGDFSLMNGFKVNIYDNTGKQVFNAQINSQQFVIKLSTLGSKGIYTLHLLDSNNNSIQTKQIVLE